MYKVGDLVKEPFSGYKARIVRTEKDCWGEYVYYLEGVSGYFDFEELELVESSYS